ncbi:hypothetical protein M3Y99_01943100 [Aphelenchoides fujianensis]|nr:hypothetical protein M3Y99_01943100 [Aphelenchoides fujianensis]
MDLKFTSQFPLRSVENKAARSTTKKRAKKAVERLERADWEQIEPTVWFDRTLDDQTFAVLVDVYLDFEWLDRVAEALQQPPVSRTTEWPG